MQEKPGQKITIAQPTLNNQPAYPSKFPASVTLLGVIQIKRDTWFVIVSPKDTWGREGVN